MILKLKWSLNIFTLGILVFLFACQFPSKLVKTVSQMRGAVSPTRNARLTVSVLESPLSPISDTRMGTGSPIPNTGTTYLGQDGTLQPSVQVSVTEYPGLQTVNPEKVTLTTVPEVTTGDQSSYTTSTTSTITQPSYTSYPGAESPIGLESTQYSAYPSPEITSNLPTPTITFSPTGGLVGTATSRSTPSDITANTTPSRSADQTSTPIPTVFIVPTATPTPTKTPFQTPTPTVTSTPTNTRTPLPFPPWISSKLRATDPSAVRLASGKIQLVEFFAYWNGPSQAMAPLLLGLEKEYQGRINFIYLDTDNPANITFKRQLGFQREPQFFLLDPQGKIFKEWIGYVTVAQLRMAFDTALH